MDADEPGLFDLPQGGPPPPIERKPNGRVRETWVRVVTAAVTIVDRAAVREFAAGLGNIGPGEFDALALYVDPTAGLEELLDADAFRIVSLAVETEAVSVDRGTITWAVTAKLRDVRALRRIAVGAHPDEAESIADSLAVAWTLAADPFAPLRRIPDVSWEPRQVDVRHLPRRQPRSQEAPSGPVR